MSIGPSLRRTLYKLAEKEMSPAKAKFLLNIWPPLFGTGIRITEIADDWSHQGIGLQIPPYKYASVEDLIDSVAKTGEPGLIVCLDNITDPRNLGAVIRSVAAFGGHGVVIPERRSAAITGVAWRTSAGTAARLPVARATNMVRSLKQFQKAGYQVVGLDAGGDHTLDTYDGTTPVVVVVGSEGKGLSRLVRDTCDTIMSIPMTGWVESLNASVAAGVTLSEFARQRRAKSSE
ncbi:23S rRNA (guanosine(2251)-2'-O)-methyltransferase RlmB [Corynebacterium amycolatum]